MAKTYKHVGSVPFKIKRSGPKKPSPKPPGLPKNIAGREASDWKRKARDFVKGALVGLGRGGLASGLTKRKIRSAVREAAEAAADEFTRGRKKPPTK